MLRCVCLLLLTVAAIAQQTPPTFRIAGTVVDDVSGVSLPGTRIALSESFGNGSKKTKSVFTDPDGKFVIDGLSPEKYGLYAEALGYPYQAFETHAGGYNTGIVVGAGVDSEHIVFRLHRSASISGMVTDELKEPLRAAKVMFFYRGHITRNVVRHVFDVETDDEGRYYADIPLEGVLFIGVSTKPWYAQIFPERHAEDVSQEVLDKAKLLDVAYPVTYYPSAQSPETATPIELHYGDHITADIELKAVPAVHLGLQGNRGGTVELKRNTFGNYEIEPQYSQIDRMGRSVIGGIAPGPYVLYYHLADRDTNSSQRQELFVGGNMTIDPEAIAKSTFARITGRVHLINEKDELPIAVIAIRSVGGANQKVVGIGRDGTFSFENVVPGQYEVGYADETGMFPQAVHCTGAKCFGQTVVVESSAQVALTVDTSIGYGDIRGFAKEGETGASGTMIALAPENGNSILFRFDQSDSDGSFHLMFVSPGRYTLISIKGGWDLDIEDPQVRSKYLAEGTPVDVVAGGKYDVLVKMQHTK